MIFSDLQRCAAASPSDTALIVKLAEVALDAQREDEAIGQVEAAAQAAQSHARLWQWTALLHRGLDRRDLALCAFEQAARCAPNDVSIAHGRARTALEAGLPAVDLYRAAQRLAPNDGATLLGLVAAQVALGRGVEAMAGLDDLLAQHPDWLAGHHDLANLRWMTGDHKGFAASYDRALRAAPRHERLHYALIQTLIETRRFDLAGQAIDRARGHIGASRQLDVHAAATLAELGDASRADAAFERVAGVRDVSLAVYRVRHLLRTGRIEQARAEAESWIGTPDEGAMWPYAALIWRLVGDPRWDWLEGDKRLVGVIDIGKGLGSIAALAEHLRALHRAAGEQFGQSVRGGTQTNGILFARIEPELRMLREAVADAVRGHVAGLPALDSRHPTLRGGRARAPRFSGSWSVRLGGSGYHSDHIHPEGWLSSALYITVPDHDPASPQAGWLALGGSPSDLGLGLAPTRMVEPKAGRLVLFPSSMWHGTTPFAEGERLTVAFDVQLPSQAMP